MFRSFIQKIIVFLAQHAVEHFDPVIIAVTGSVGKTSTKEAISTVLKEKFNVRQSTGNVNTSIGVSLAILGFELRPNMAMKTGSHNPFTWLTIFIRGFWRAFFSSAFPEILVLEYAADKPGDIAFLAKTFPPSIGVITAIGDYPVHVEFYNSPEAVAKEKSQVIASLKGERGFAVLNYDDQAIRKMVSLVPAEKTAFFGFDPNANFRATDIRLWRENDVPMGQSFNILHEGAVVPIKIPAVFGKGAIYAALAAATVGNFFGLNLLEIGEALVKFKSPPGRMNLEKGIKDSWIINDSYNASPAAVHAALDLLKEFPASKRIAVLGDMLELGAYTEKAHREIGTRVAEVVDELIIVGARAKFIADEALRCGMDKEKVFEFDNTAPAALKLQERIEPGAVSLIKASRAMRFENIVEKVIFDN